MYYLEPMSGLTDTLNTGTKVLGTGIGVAVGASLGGIGKGGIGRRLVLGAAGGLVSYLGISLLLERKSLYELNPLREAGERIADSAAGLVYGENVCLPNMVDPETGFCPTGIDAQAEMRANAPNVLITRQNRDTAYKYQQATGVPGGGLTARWGEQNRSYRWNEETNELLAIPYDQAVLAAARVQGPQDVVARHGLGRNTRMVVLPDGPPSEWDQAWYYDRGDLSGHPDIIARHV